MADPAVLSELQLFILSLEDQTWKRDGAKYSAFKQRYPSITATGYDHALLVLLRHPAALTHDGGRYAPLVHRLRRLLTEKIERRGF